MSKWSACSVTTLRGKGLCDKRSGSTTRKKTVIDIPLLSHSFVDRQVGTACITVSVAYSQLREVAFRAYASSVPLPLYRDRPPSELTHP
jgi:hypothetical protein